MIRIAICDTDKEFVEKLIVLLREEALKKNIETKFSKFSSSNELMEALKNGAKVDVVFLETHIGDECGVILGKDIKSFDKKIELVYLSYTKKYVLDCFDMGAFNYILKPINDDERLLTQFERLLIKKYQDRGDYLAIKEQGTLLKLRVDKISYMETVGKLVRVHYEDKFVDVHERMGDLEKKLENLFFIRCHTSYLINAKYILRVNKVDLKLIDDTSIPVSRLRMKKVKETLDEFFENRDLI
ncbi:LytTR family DNA-binding domain-containing protein [uncultured Clostridium sp.]|uniref:LytR/AlgR family response regulator transcription factor n=1 Tax=uncultured Clostridium sp. TaxID=59620 RepID=UPI0026048EA3|nr:LytTR family DNA-binding domain-containing protein [uncultured Clostridium sp.]